MTLGEVGDGGAHLGEWEVDVDEILCFLKETRVSKGRGGPKIGSKIGSNRSSPPPYKP